MKYTQTFFKSVPKLYDFQGKFYICSFCKTSLSKDLLEKNLYVCYVCSYHFPICSHNRLDIFLDKKERNYLIHKKAVFNKMDFFEKKSYKEKICFAKTKTKKPESVISIQGNLYGVPVVASAFEFSFMGGSMGSSFGNQFLEVTNIAIKNKFPLVFFLSSGGARIQEGLFSLFQMSKVSILIGELKKSNIPYISVLLHPTMGGVLATLGMLGDVIIAEPHSLTGFSGKNIISKTVALKTSKEFQSSDHMMDYGSIDGVVDRKNIRDFIFRIISKLTKIK